MKITISAELTQEQVLILSSKKGYQDKIQSKRIVEIPYNEFISMDGSITPAGISQIEENCIIDNPQTREEYLKEVYTGIITSDATNVFVQYAKEQRSEQERIEQETIRENVVASIASYIE